MKGTVSCRHWSLLKSHIWSRSRWDWISMQARVQLSISLSARMINTLIQCGQNFIIMCILCLLLALTSYALSQSLLIQDTPTDFQAATLTLVINQPLSQSTKLTPVTFGQAMSATPLAMLALTHVQEVQQSIKLFQSVVSISSTSLLHSLALTDPSDCIVVLRVRYAALVESKFSFLSVKQTDLTGLSLAVPQYIQVSFLNTLSANTYDINVFLTGFQVSGALQTGLGITAEISSLTTYLLGIQLSRAILEGIQFTRILIDQTAYSSQVGTGLGEITLSSGFVQHYESYMSLAFPAQVFFYPSGFFMGIAQFSQGLFDIVSNPSKSIYVRPELNFDIIVDFMVFMEKKCSDEQPLYNPVSQLCYPSCGVKTYSVNPGTRSEYCDPCHISCYTCSGPSASQCLSCLGDRDAVGTTCVCKADTGEDPLTGYCQPCSFFVPFCQKCNLVTFVCSVCPFDCILGASGCECPANKCGQNNDYISPQTGACECLPEFYRGANQVCSPCAAGCYICSGYAKNCSVCMDKYFLMNSQCLFLHSTTLLVDSNTGYVQEGDWCLTKVGGDCIAQCPDATIMFESKCYPPATNGQTDTFKIIDAYGNTISQPCPAPCVACRVYYSCLKCDEAAGFYLTDTGSCESCGAECQSCTQAGNCTDCAYGFQSDGNGSCFQDISGFSMEQSCPLGCHSCAIEQYCEKCEPAYFLLTSNHSCMHCSQLEGASISTEPTLSVLGQAAFYCQEVCGDGLVINQMCDDGNTVSGDGCSSSCQMEAGYQCQYLSTDTLLHQKSVCFQPDYLVQFESEYVLSEKNMLVLTLTGNGMALAHIDYIISCQKGGHELDFTLKSVSAVDALTLTYSLQIHESFEGAVCIFQPNGTDQASMKPQNFTISGVPAAFARTGYIEQVIQLFVVILEYSHKPLAFLIWILCIISVDTLDAWLNTSFIVFFISFLYEKDNMPNNVYAIFSHLRYLVFDWDHATSPQEYLRPAQNLLIFMAAMVVWNELILRILKITKIFPRKQCQLFTYVFRNRFLLYVAVFVSFEPVILFYTIKIFPLLPALAPLIVFILNIILFFVSMALLIHQTKRMLKQKSLRRFIFLLVNGKSTAVLMAIAFYVDHENLQNLIFGIIQVGLAFSAIVSLADGYIDKVVEEDPPDNDQSSSFNSQNQIEQEEYESPLELRKGTFRKVNIGIQYTSFIIIIILRVVYHSNDKYSSAYQLLGCLILAIFLFLNLFFCTILGIASQCVSIMIYLSAECPPQAVSGSSVHPEGNEEREEESSPSLSQIFPNQ